MFVLLEILEEEQFDLSLDKDENMIKIDVVYIPERYTTTCSNFKRQQFLQSWWCLRKCEKLESESTQLRFLKAVEVFNSKWF